MFSVNTNNKVYIEPMSLVYIAATLIAIFIAYFLIKSKLS